MVSDLIAVPILVGTLGLVGICTGWSRWRIHCRIAAVTPTSIRQIASAGVVEVEGQLSPVEESVTAPITGREAAVAAWTVEVWDERGDASTWRPVARGIEMPAVEISDSTGAIEVRPVSERETAEKWTQTTDVSASEGVRIDDALAEFDSFPVELELGPDEERPDGVQRLHNEHGLSEGTGPMLTVVDGGEKHGRRRYSEQVIAPGETGYVHGAVEAREDPTRERLNPNDGVVTTPPDGLFIVSNQDGTSLKSEFGSTARSLVAGGAVATVLGAVGVASLLLPA
jgi:hypothetical protein